VKARGDDLAQVSVHDRDGITIATITGEVDLSNAAEVGQKLTDLPNVAPGLIVDLRGTSYVDSTGIALLCDLALRLRQRSQPFVIVSAPSSAARRVLEISGFHTQITIADEMAPAISLLQLAIAPES
jgi:anti-sigma B factor antagonist